MKILLISANNLIVPYPVYPLGLDYVENSISDNHDTRIVDMNDLKENFVLGEMIKEFAPEVIGLSLRNIDNTDILQSRSFIDDYKELMKIIRLNSAAPVVLGGSGFTLFPEELLNELQADYGIIGEGERFGLLLQALLEGTDPAAVPGVFGRGSRAYIPVPWENRFARRFKVTNHHINFYLKRGGMLNLQTHRGCSFKCIYCTYPHIEGSHLRLIPPAQVAHTARALQDANARYLFITDSAFNCSFEHSLNVAKAFIKAGVSIPWGAFFAPISPPADYFKTLHDAGLTHVEFGTESLSDEMLAVYRKPFMVDDVFAAHRSALEEGLYVAHYLLLGGPGESRGTLLATLENANGLEKTVLFFFCGIRIYPHTELYEIAIREGQISAHHNLLRPVFYRSPKISTEEIVKQVEEYANGRLNWIIGTTGDKMAKIMSRMYARGYYGPLWENLIQ